MYRMTVREKGGVQYVQNNEGGGGTHAAPTKATRNTTIEASPRLLVLTEERRDRRNERKEGRDVGRERKRNGKNGRKERGMKERKEDRTEGYRGNAHKWLGNGQKIGRVIGG
jgi:hypothetical protein